jgi:hypothetical protein
MKKESPLSNPVVSRRRKKVHFLIPSPRDEARKSALSPDAKKINLRYRGVAKVYTFVIDLHTAKTTTKVKDLRGFVSRIYKKHQIDTNK